MLKDRKTNGETLTLTCWLSAVGHDDSFISVLIKAESGSILYESSSFRFNKKFLQHKTLQHKADVQRSPHTFMVSLKHFLYKLNFKMKSELSFTFGNKEVEQSFISF